MKTNLRLIKEKITRPDLYLNYTYVFKIIEEKPDKKELVVNVIKKCKSDDFVWGTNLANKLNNSIISNLKMQHFWIKNYKGRLAYRAVFGIGHPSPLEVGLKFHKIFAIPYIPGSSIKGAVRAALLFNISKILDVEVNELLNILAESIKIAEKENTDLVKDFTERVKSKTNNSLSEKHQELLSCLINFFGTEVKRGKLLFLDAFPAKGYEQILDPDVMTPIYGPEGKPEHEARPSIIPFLALKPGIRFDFYVLSNTRLSPMEEEVLDEAFRIALEEFGLGAKTSLGYGIFKLEGWWRP